MAARWKRLVVGNCVLDNAIRSLARCRLQNQFASSEGAHRLPPAALCRTLDGGALHAFVRAILFKKNTKKKKNNTSCSYHLISLLLLEFLREVCLHVSFQPDQTPNIVCHTRRAVMCPAFPISRS